METTKQAATKVHGPFECITLNEQGEGTPVLVLPYSEVEASQLLAHLIDNTASNNGASSDSQFWIMIEVGIWGSLQGYESLIKRTTLSPRTGPMSYLFGFAEAYDKVIIKARNMSGGRRGPGINGVVTLANGFSAPLTVNVQPRGGFRPAAGG